MADAILGHRRFDGKPTTTTFNMSSFIDALSASTALPTATVLGGLVQHHYVDADTKVTILAAIDETGSAPLEDIVAALPGHPKPAGAALAMVMLRIHGDLIDANILFSRTRQFGVKVHGISILEQAQSGGHMLTVLISTYSNRFEMEIMGMIMLGGRAADIVLGKGGHTGAEGDIEAASRMISGCIATYGLCGTLAPLRDHARDVHRHTDKILRRLLQQFLEVVRRDRHRLVRLAEYLVFERVMTPEAIEVAWHDDSVLISLPASGSKGND